MMNLINKYKNYLVLIFIAFLGYIAYSMFFAPDKEQEQLLETTEAKSIDVLGEEIIRAINQIQSLTLDESVLSDPILNSLIDLSEPIQPEPVGRRNPFEPFEGEGADTTDEDGTEIQTESEGALEDSEPNETTI